MVSDMQVKELLDFLEARDLVANSLGVDELITAALTAKASNHLTITGVTGKDIKLKLTDAAGARKIIVLDSADAEVGTIDSNGVFTAAGGFVGAITGAVTGNVTGDVTGDLTGNVTGNSTGSHTGDVVNNAAVAVSFANGHADYTLSSSEKKGILLVAASADQAANIIAPAENRLYVLRNGAGAAITIKKSGGTGVAVADGKTAVVMYNGTDYVRVTADATH